VREGMQGEEYERRPEERVGHAFGRWPVDSRS
jgi:hypothetical protein